MTSTFAESRTFGDNIQLWTMGQLSDLSIVPYYYHDATNVQQCWYSLPLEPTLSATQLCPYGCWTANQPPMMDVAAPAPAALQPIEVFEEGIRSTMDQIRKGQFTNASKSLLDISTRLVDNAGEIGIDYQNTVELRLIMH